MNSISVPLNIYFQGLPFQMDATLNFRFQRPWTTI